MPFYKRLSNRFLTWCENKVFELKLSEYHTGFRAFRRSLLETTPFLLNSNDFIFDQEIVAQAVWFGARLEEISVPHRYFPEASTIGFGRSVRYGLWRSRSSRYFSFKPQRLDDFPDVSSHASCLCRDGGCSFGRNPPVPDTSPCLRSSTSALQYILATRFAAGFSFPFRRPTICDRGSRRPALELLVHLFGGLAFPGDERAPPLGRPLLLCRLPLWLSGWCRRRDRRGLVYRSALHSTAGAWFGILGLDDDSRRSSFSPPG